MNESGGSVSALLKYYSTDLDHLVVVHDELDIPAGVVRVKRGGGKEGTTAFARCPHLWAAGTTSASVSASAGRPDRMDPADFVLRDFSAAERTELPLTVDTAADAVESLVEVGLLETQQRFHAP